jgi:hypothetical protein
MSGDTDPEATTAFTFEDDTASFIVVPKPGAVAAEPTRADVLREPRRLGDLLGDEGVPTLEGPVLVSHAGNPADELLRAVVYPIASMAAGAAPAAFRLEDELARFGVGRTSANDIVIDDFTVSKRHASIVRHSANRWSVVDEGSSNGTFADSRKLDRGEPCALGVVTALRFGPRARFAFLHPTPFAEYAAFVRDEARRRSIARPLLPPILAPPQRPFDMVRKTQAGGTFEPLAARIVSRLRAAAGARRYVLRREGLPPIELELVSEVVTLVEQAPRAVLAVAAVADRGSEETIYLRDPV